MNGKQFTQNQAAYYATLAYQATTANQANNITSPSMVGAYFIGHISPDMTTCTDPSGVQYNLTFSGNPREYDVCQNVGNGNAICVAAEFKQQQLGTTKKRLWGLYLQSLLYSTYAPTKNPKLYNPQSQTGTTSNSTNYKVVFLSDLKSQKIAQVFDTNLGIVDPVTGNVVVQPFVLAPFLSDGSQAPLWTQGSQLDNTGNNLIVWMVSFSFQAMGGETVFNPGGAAYADQSTILVNLSYRVFTNIGLRTNDKGISSFTYSSVYSMDNFPVYTCSTADSSFSLISAVIADPSFNSGVYEVNPIGEIANFNGLNWYISGDSINIILGLITTVAQGVVSRVTADGQPFDWVTGFVDFYWTITNPGSVDNNVYEIVYSLDIVKDIPAVESTQVTSLGVLAEVGPGVSIFPTYDNLTPFFPSYAYSLTIPFTYLAGPFSIEGEFGQTVAYTYYLYTQGFNFSSPVQVNVSTIFGPPVGNYPISFRVNSKGNVDYVYFDDIQPMPASWTNNTTLGIKWLNNSTSLIVDPVLTASVYQQNSTTNPISYNKRLGTSYTFSEVLIPPLPANQVLASLVDLYLS